MRILLFAGVCGAWLALAAAPPVRSENAAAPAIEVSETAEQVQLRTPELEAAVRKQGYVSGVAGGSFVDRKTGFRDAGFGLDIIDWIMEPGSDEAYRSELPGDLAYVFNNVYHGKTPKRSIEGPQICTQAKELQPEVIRGKDFVAVKNRFQYRLAAPGKKTGSRWEQTLVFPAGKRYFLSSDRITAVNGSDAMFLRLDMPGHIKHQRGDTFSEVYLSYHTPDRLPASEFFENFAPDEKFNYRRDRGTRPKRFIRAYRLRDPKTGKQGPWLAGMTLDPSAVYEAWCHQRGYVCMIEEFGGRKIRPGQSFSAAFLVGYFDSIEEMHQVYDQHAGHLDLRADEKGWELLKRTLQPIRTQTATASSHTRNSPKGSKPSTFNLPTSQPRGTSQPNRTRLEDRLEWFQDQKFGFFVHWGVYSQWGCIESWPLVEVDTWARPEDLPAWVQRGKDMERFKRDYWALNRTFNPTKFDPQQWVQAAKQAGMKYFVFTTKHHDGFSMWDTKQTDYRITHPDTPFSTHPRADVVRQVFDAFRKEGFGLGAYFSKADWHHPDYWSPEAPAKTRNPNYDTLAKPYKWRRFVDFVHNQIEELVTGYGPFDILWLDAGQVRPPKQDIRMDRLAAMARRHQPGLIIVDRTVGGEYENYRTPEQQVPDKPLPYVWETCMTMGDQWSYKPDDRYKSTRELIHLLADIVAKGGNFLLNVGPQPDGQLPPPALERMREIGDWMEINGEAIYGTRPIAPYKVNYFALTQKQDHLYGIYLPEKGVDALPARLVLPSVRPQPGSAVRLLGSRKNVAWRMTDQGLELEIPNSVARATAGRHAWAFKIRQDN